MYLPLGLLTAAVHAALWVGCSAPPNESLQLAQVDLDLMHIPAPAGHQYRSAVSDQEGGVWISSLDGGLSYLPPRGQNFRLMSPDFETLGTQVEKLQMDPKTQDVLFKAGYKHGRIVRYTPSQRTAQTLSVNPTPAERTDHTQPKVLIQPSRSDFWGRDFTILPNGDIWAVSHHASPGIHARLGSDRYRFLPTQEGEPLPELLVSDSQDSVWSISTRNAHRIDALALSFGETLEFPKMIQEKSRFLRKPWPLQLHSATLSGPNLWVATDRGVLRRSGGEMEHVQLIGTFSRYRRFSHVVHHKDLLWGQYGDSFWKIKESPRIQYKEPIVSLPSDFFPALPSARLLSGETDSLVWIGSSIGVYRFDPLEQKRHTHRTYRWPWTLPSAEPSAVRRNLKRARSTFALDVMPQQILRVQDGALWHAGWNSLPSPLDSQSSLWEPLPNNAGAKLRINTTAVTYDGIPVLIGRRSIRRWDPNLRVFANHVDVHDVLRPEEWLEIGLDQYGGILVFGCPTGPGVGAITGCRKAAYIAANTTVSTPIRAKQAGCFKPIQNGVFGWETSDRQVVNRCTQDILFPGNAPFELAGGLRTAVASLLNRDAEEFTPLTTLSPELGAAWVLSEGKPAIWRLDGSLSPVSNAPTLSQNSADLRATRFTMDTRGDLCHLRPTNINSQARIWCINAFGSTVISVEDTEGLLGDLQSARILASPKGHIWIDGLRGRVGWVDRERENTLRVFNLPTVEPAPGSTVTRSRIMGFDLDDRAIVSADEVIALSPHFRPRDPRAQRSLSATRFWKRSHWPLSTMTVAGRTRFVAATPAGLVSFQLQTTPQQNQSVSLQPLNDEKRQLVGPNVAFIQRGLNSRELWVGLRDGGVLHYNRTDTPQRYSRAEGLRVPEILSMTVLDVGAVVVTPSGVYWLNPTTGHAQRILLPKPINPSSITSLVPDLTTSDKPGTAFLFGSSSGHIGRVVLPVDPPSPNAAPTPSATITNVPTTITPIETEPLYNLGRERPITALLHIPASQSASGHDELVIGTKQGLFVQHRSAKPNAAPTPPEPVRRHRYGPVEGEVTALTLLPDGRIAAAFWNDDTSQVSLHNVSTNEWWPMAHPDASSRVYALEPLSTPAGDVYLVARQRETISMTVLPLVTPTQIPPWLWLLGGFGLVAATAAALIAQRRNPILMRLKADPEGVRDSDLLRLPSIDRAIDPARTNILVAAGIMEDRWNLAVRLGSIWPQGYHWPLRDDEPLIDTICEILGVDLLSVEGSKDGSKPVPLVCKVRLPRLPINLPTRETLLLFLMRDDLGRDFLHRDPRFLEDRLGHILREHNQSMGTPFLLVSNLGTDETLPTLVHARFPGVLFRSDRLRDIALADLPRLSLSRAILMDAWLDAISPYKSSGPVDDPAMFMGRERVRRELLSARSMSAIICGGRRVGKTSLIRQLVRDLGREQADLTVYEISLLGIRSYADFIDRIERRLGITVRMSGDPESSPTQERPAFKPEDLSSPPDVSSSPRIAVPRSRDAGDSKDPKTSKTSALARLRRRRARRSNPSLSPEIACAALREALEVHHIKSGQTPLLILDEIDGIAARDAENGYPLLATLHQLKGEGICSFLLVGFAELYRQTYDYDSPLYNFARVLRLAGLDENSALRLVTEPMARLGVQLTDPTIASRIVEETAGFPNLIQFICDMLLKRLSEHRRTVAKPEDLDAILDFSNPASQPLSSYLSESFDQNVDRREEILVYSLLLYGPRPASLSDIDANLSRLGIETQLAERRAMVRRLKLVGIFKELSGETFDLALPLLVRLLLAKDLKAAVAALVDEV